MVQPCRSEGLVKGNGLEEVEMFGQEALLDPCSEKVRTQDKSIRGKHTAYRFLGKVRTIRCWLLICAFLAWREVQRGILLGEVRSPNRIDNFYNKSKSLEVIHRTA